jgi:hypothetical protein
MTPPAPAGASALAPPVHRGPREIKLVSHSPIFYWWPIWLLGYVMALVTWLDGTRLTIVPADARLSEMAEPADKGHKNYKLQIPSGETTKVLSEAVTASADSSVKHPFKYRVSPKTWMGPLYCVILLLTILITNIPLRGLWSFLVLMMLVVVALILTVFDAWEPLLGAIGNLHIYINMAGYLFIATTVLVLWAASVFVFDQRTYMVVSPGNVRVCEHIGASIRNIDSTGLEFEKQRDDLFRHWILGFFSGDLIIHMADKREQIRLPNVLWIGWRLEEVQEILREKATVINP